MYWDAEHMDDCITNFDRWRIRWVKLGATAIRLRKDFHGLPSSKGNISALTLAFVSACIWTKHAVHYFILVRSLEVLHSTVDCDTDLAHVLKCAFSTNFFLNTPMCRFQKQCFIWRRQKLVLVGSCWFVRINQQLQWSDKTSKSFSSLEKLFLLRALQLKQRQNRVCWSQIIAVSGVLAAIATAWRTGEIHFWKCWRVTW